MIIDKDKIIFYLNIDIIISQILKNKYSNLKF